MHGIVVSQRFHTKWTHFRSHGLWFRWDLAYGENKNLNPKFWSIWKIHTGYIFFWKSTKNVDGKFALLPLQIFNEIYGHNYKKKFDLVRNYRYIHKYRFPDNCMFYLGSLNFISTENRSFRGNSRFIPGIFAICMTTGDSNYRIFIQSYLWRFFQ